MKKRLIIVGAGGFAAEAHWLATAEFPYPRGSDWLVLGFVDETLSHDVSVMHCGLPVYRHISDVPSADESSLHYHCAIGRNDVRLRLSDEMDAAGLIPATIMHPSAIVAETAQVGTGSFIGAGCIVAPYAVIGKHVIVNIHASVGHHATISDFAQICPGARVSGGCQVGRGAFIGSNASLQPKTSVGDLATLGANSFAVKDVASGTTALGVPARTIM